ncbi:isocitrate lyase/phosphoenolpyruvate mutase family protein [Parafrigoribacterium mesophilum]|uniref:isocitrate lyase/PEP mutase family protein n=1 Tax=Parafrigoribacterium mesophilum TaxID=433646 RepID=UPI0031FC0203
MRTINEVRQDFLALHVPGTPLLIPNPWDLGSAKLLATLGFRALATTSSGFAATLGRADGEVSREEAIAHAAALADAVEVPVSADLEHGFGAAPDAVFATVSAAAATGLAGCSIEDFSGNPEAPIYPIELAAERIAAAVQAAHEPDVPLVLTARAENLIHGIHDLDDTILRLQAFQEAGADVLYAPGLTRLEDVRSVISAVDLPVNVLARPGLGSVAELAAASVARISVGGGFAFASFAALTRAGAELLEHGNFGYLNDAAQGHAQLVAAINPPAKE